jgi:hypothetical protein
LSRMNWGTQELTELATRADFPMKKSNQLMLVGVVLLVSVMGLIFARPTKIPKACS